MNHVIPLMQREWLQHRFACALMLLLPATIAVLALTFGEVVLDATDVRLEMPVARARASLAGGVCSSNEINRLVVFA